MGDCGRDDDLCISGDSLDSERSCCDDISVPGRGHDPETLQHVLSCVCEVPDLDVLEEGELEGVTADCDDLDLGEIHVEGCEQVVDSRDHQTVCDVLTCLHCEVDVVDDIHSRDGVTLGDRGCQGGTGVEIYCLATETAGSDI